jgi:endonuclease/exonuclease/phosphatase family metal-dependent hydrolase
MRNVRLTLVAALTASLATACDDEDEPQPMDVVVETFNVGLAGAFIPHEEARRQQMAAGLAASPADVVCLQEVWLRSDKEAIAAGVASVFPHAVWDEHDLDTPLDDPEDQDGAIPPPPTVPPCDGEALEATLDAALACLSENCSTAPGSDDGRTTSTACAQDACIAQVAGMVITDDLQTLRCYACLATGLPTSTFGEIRDRCTSEVNGELAFDGQSGVMILSRYPLRNAESWVVPGTWNRRVIARATVSLPNGADADVYCNHLTPIFDDIAFPYTGVYGQGALGADGWATEQLLQAEKLLAYVERTSDGRPSFVLGDFNASREIEVGGEVVSHDEGLATLTLLESVLVPAVAEGFVAACTHCPDNANTSESTLPVWIDHIFLAGLPAAAVVSTERVYDEAVVAVDGGARVPLSDHYGLRAVVTVAP